MFDIQTKLAWWKKHLCIIFNIQQNLNFPTQNWESGFCFGFLRKKIEFLTAKHWLIWFYLVDLEMEISIHADFGLVSILGHWLVVKILRRPKIQIFNGLSYSEGLAKGVFLQIK